MGKINSIISNIKQYWNTPAEGNYVPYKEVMNIGVAGFGIHWASTLASAIGLSANNFIVGASIGLQPMHLQIMLILANLVGLPIAVFRGWFLDNHKLPGGKFIPILLRTPIPMVLISTIFVWFMFVILAAVLGFYNESFTYLKQVVTPNAQERANVMSISQILYSNAPSITNLVIPTVAGLTWGMDNIWTYRIIYPGFTVVGLIVLFIFVPKLKERIVIPKRPVEYVSLIDSLREVAKNKYFWIINGATWAGFLEGSSAVMINWTFNYANNGENKAYMGLANTLIANAALWSMMLAPFMIKWLGKRNLLIMHNTVNVFLYALLFVVRDNLVLMCVVFYLTTFVNTFQNVYIPNIQADMRDYHQWKTGVRVDGLFTPLTLIGTVLGFFTGLVVPAIYEKMGLLDDYTVLYNDELRNNLFTVLIICSVIGSVMNLIPYLFYDLTELKHRGYVNVLKIRAMFEDYGNGELDDGQLVDAMKIIKAAKDNVKPVTVDKSTLKAARKIKDKAECKAAVSKAKQEIREAKKFNEFAESLPIVREELYKFDTERYKKQLAAAENTFSMGELCLYSDWQTEMSIAKALPKATTEQKEIRSDALNLVRLKKRSAKLILKHGKENIVLPDVKIKEEIQNREINTIKERIAARNDLKAYTKAVSVYRRATLPYENARQLIIQAENYNQLGEIELLYDSVVSKAE